MYQIFTRLTLLLSDDRSAVQRKTAALSSLAVLVTAATGLLLMSLGEQTYRDYDRRILTASRDLASGPLL